MRFPAVLLVLLSLLATAGCALRPPEPPHPPTPPGEARLTVGVGFEDVTAGRDRLDDLRRRLDQVGAAGVTLGVGRPDWTAFAWPAHPDARADGDADHVRAAIAALGAGRDVTLVIDVLAPRLLQAHPEEAAVDEHGHRSDLFAGAAALNDGEVGRRIVELCGTVAERYRPTRVALTELFLVDVFSPADLRRYRELTGRDDWPRTASGAIDTGHARVAELRADAVTTLATRCAEAAARYGVGSEVDVRVSWTDPGGGRPDSGHDYARLLGRVDRLMVWNYFALAGRPPTASAELTAGLRGRLGADVGRLTLSVGLWSGGAENQTDQHNDTVSPADMAAGVRASLTNGVAEVAVTPASRLTDAHWAALAGLGFRR